MWTGISGLLAHGERMNVLGNNIANVNTVGFKGARMDFEDFISQDVNTASGTRQVGRGVGIGTIYGDFSQGSFETTTEATDLAIGGRGFFAVSPKGEETAYYTRAGNFRFDKEGYLVDPHGYVLQGWQIETPRPSLATSTAGSVSSTSKIKGAGVPKDIQLPGFTAEPKHTSNVTIISNLDDASGGDNSTNAANPMFALFNSWDGTAEPPLSENSFAYQTTIKVYDEGGTAHNLTIYYDQVASDTISGEGSGQKHWEYIVTMDPADEQRSINGIDFKGTPAAGMLMAGTLTFDSSGQLIDQSAFTPGSSATGSMKDLSNWNPTTFSTNGYPMFVANFSGISNASYVTPNPDPAAQPYIMELNLGLKNSDPSTWASAGVSNASLVGTNVANLPSLGNQAERQSSATTSFSGSSSTPTRYQDGYTFGFLQNVTVTRDGILQGRYSNGAVLDLYQITLYDFQSKDNLRREGGNLFSESNASGLAAPGPANANGYGTVNSNSLEQSNVDLAKEFVNMITTQRGFQSNSKVITTTDTMLEVVIQMKR
jgi:flagellar hook protein FlgE